MSERATIKLTLDEAGAWWEIDIHSLEMPRGAQWDAVNGWRHDVEKVLGETGNDGALDRRYGRPAAQGIMARRVRDAHIKERQKRLAELMRQGRLRIKATPKAEREALYEAMYDP